MSNIHLIIPERATSIGNFMVGRLLPFREKRMVGPFTFWDHMGPTKMNERENFDVQPHPHIGLSTLTFLFEGSIMHRDTLGNEVEITAGAVNWMTAGKWIVHSERTPEYLRHSEKRMHGLQIWVALPKDLENREPEFFHLEASKIPVWTEGYLQFKLIAGEVMGHKSPVPIYSPLYLIEIKSKARQTVAVGTHLFGESALYISEGGIESDGNKFQPKQLLVAKESKLCSFTILENSTIYILGGMPFPEPRYIDWNFVASDIKTIREAKEKWNSGNWEKIKTDAKEFVPYPSQQPK